MYSLLLVDDEKLARETLIRLIQRKSLPIKIYEAKNGREAINSYKKYNQDFVFLDIQMPGINGIEAGKEIKSYDEKALIVYLTAYDLFDYAREAIQVGVKDYLVKPVDFSVIYKTLDKLMKIIDLRKSEIHVEKEKMREVINQFSSSFFNSLKFGQLSDEMLYSYFSFAKEDLINGVSLVIKGINKQKLEKVMSRYKDCRTKFFCFEAIDRISLIVFSKDLDCVLSYIRNSFLLDCVTIGIGTVFTSLSLINTSLANASKAFSFALTCSLSCHKFSIDDIDYSAKSNVNDIISKIENSVEKMDLVMAQTYVQLLTDCYIDTKDENISLQEYYEKVLILQYSFFSSIDYLSFPPLQKISINQLTSYLMEMIKKSIHALEIDRVDKWKRSFEYIESYLQSNYSMNISLEDISSLLKINEKYFSKLFRKYLGKKFIDYLTEIRMKNAVVFLSMGASVRSTAEKTGYNDSAYFSKVFQQYYGENPSIYCKNKGN